MKDLKGDNTPAAKRRSKLAITIANLEEKIKTHMQKTTKMSFNKAEDLDHALRESKRNRLVIAKMVVLRNELGGN
ncbi:hypothetical protein ACO22_03275 [Paracoccidioides brasiliensis]|uniref:Uncharacterized protein n=1 Tax=Paracoccidioides brasiliensis TaxID=121759 RepID=A0A1D2JGF3_PARBR|nr:hypothetical protein ACO22_03275 [Paracoccidioides brasiliensis]